MDGLAALVFLLMPFYLLRQVTLWAFPGLVEPLEAWALNTARWTWGLVKECGWKMPASRYGVGKTLWLWSLAGATAVTALLILNWRPGAWRTIVLVWVVAAASWWGLHGWAERRYRPRPLRARRRRR